MDSRTRHHHETAICRFSLGIGLICATAWTGFASQSLFEVGQRWQYRHEGPRPGSFEPNAIGGERILWVLAHIKGQGGTQWVVEERFTRDEKAIGRLSIREDGLLEAIEIENDKGETARLRYDPPIPYQPTGMAVGEKKTISTSLRLDSADFTLPSMIVTERLADETIATPAGEFPGCSHYRIATTSTVNIKIAKIPITEEREQWHHPTVHGMVKEVYRRGPVKFLTWSRPGYTATSTLTTYDRQEPEPAQRVAAPDVPERTENEGQPSQKPGNQVLSWKHWIPPATLLVLVAGGFVLAMRRRNR
jgi:hypothetical protein